MATATNLTASSSQASTQEWTEAETRELLKCVKKLGIRGVGLDCNSMYRNEDVFSKFSEQLQSLSIKKHPELCRKQLKWLQDEYNKIANKEQGVLRS